MSNDGQTKTTPSDVAAAWAYWKNGTAMQNRSAAERFVAELAFFSGWMMRGNADIERRIDALCQEQAHD